jgi:hypothetical protein
MAPKGHAVTQASQPLQSSWSTWIAPLLPLFVSAPTGQALTQAGSSQNRQTTGVCLPRASSERIFTLES